MILDLILEYDRKKFKFSEKTESALVFSSIVRRTLREFRPKANMKSNRIVTWESMHIGKVLKIPP